MTLLSQRTAKPTPMHFTPSETGTGQTFTPPPIKSNCSACHLKSVCLPSDMSTPDITRLDHLQFARRKLKAGDTLYRAGDNFQFIYAVRSGTLRTDLSLADGREQVSGFHIAGELMGLDGLANDRHASSATALEDSEICAIPYNRLLEIGRDGVEIQQAINKLMSREILREHELMMLLGSMNAEERLAAFLLDLSNRLAARGYSGREFHLRMSRAEIGSYLGLKLETVSRTFSAFQHKRLLEVDKRHVRIISIEDLQRVFERLH